MKKRQRILFITYENPFLRDNGDRIYTCNLLDSFIDLDCDVSIIGYDFENSNIANNVKMPNNISSTFLPFKKTSKLKIIFSLVPGMIVNRKRKSYLDFLLTHLKENKYDLIKRRLNMDLTVCGISAAKTNFNLANGITIDYVDPAYMVYSYTEDPNFEDIYYVGEVKTIPINELAKQFPHLTESDLEEIVQSKSNHNSRNSTTKQDNNSI